MQTNPGPGGYPEQFPPHSQPNGFPPRPVFLGVPPPMPPSQMPLPPPPFIQPPNPFFQPPGGQFGAPGMPNPHLFPSGMPPMGFNMQNQPPFLPPFQSQTQSIGLPVPRPWFPGPHLPQVAPQPVAPAAPPQNPIPHIDLTQEKPPVTVYVGKLPDDIDSTYVNDVLKSVGRLSKWNRAQDPDNGKFRNFGFASYRTAEEANMAMTILNGQKLMGGELLVKVGKKEQAVIDECMTSKLPNQLAVYQMRLNDARQRFMTVFNAKEGIDDGTNGEIMLFKDGSDGMSPPPLRYDDNGEPEQGMTIEKAAYAFSEAIKFRKLQEERDKKTEEFRRMELQRRLRDTQKAQIEKAKMEERAKKREEDDKLASEKALEASPKDKKTGENSNYRSDSRNRMNSSERAHRSVRRDRKRDRDSRRDERSGSRRRSKSRSHGRRSRHDGRDRDRRSHRNEKDKDTENRNHRTRRSESKPVDKEEDERRVKSRLEAAAVLERRQKDEDDRKTRQRMAVLAALGDDLLDEEEEGEIISAPSTNWEQVDTQIAATLSLPEGQESMPEKDLAKLAITPLEGLARGIEEAKKAAGGGLGFALKGGKKGAPQGKMNDVFWAEADEDKKIERPVVPIDYDEEKVPGGIPRKDRDKVLADMIPKDKDALFNYHVDWNTVKAHGLVQSKMRPWVMRKEWMSIRV